jgi:hypothetical protein
LPTITALPARTIHLVLDNLTAHKPELPIETFGQDAARRLKRIEWHPTSKHARWLDMAKVELSGPTRQGRSRRIPSLEQLERATAARVRRRHRAHARIAWTFKVHDARRVSPERYRKKLVG